MTHNQTVEFQSGINRKGGYYHRLIMTKKVDAITSKETIAQDF